MPLIEALAKSSSSWSTPPPKRSSVPPPAPSLSPNRESLSPTPPPNRESLGEPTPFALDDTLLSLRPKVIDPACPPVPILLGGAALFEPNVPLVSVGSFATSTICCLGTGTPPAGRISIADICPLLPVYVPLTCPVFRSHSCTVLSQLPLNKLVSSLLSCITETADVCPYKLVILFPS